MTARTFEPVRAVMDVVASVAGHAGGIERDRRYSRPGMTCFALETGVRPFEHEF
jgi:hypothetical protein